MIGSSVSQNNHYKYAKQLIYQKCLHQNSHSRVIQFPLELTCSFVEREREMSLSLRLLLLLNAICVLQLFPIPTLQTPPPPPPVSLIFKDKSTKLFTLQVSLKTPLRRTRLYLDLGCTAIGFGAISCTLCGFVVPRDANCVLDNFSICHSIPENPLTAGDATGLGSGLVDTLALPTTNAKAPLFLLPFS